MGIDIISYRAAIGNFYAVTHRRLSLHVFKINMSFQIYCASYTFWLLGLMSYLKNDEFSLYRLILLIMCMDIHSNPGPSSTDINTLDILHGPSMFAVKAKIYGVLYNQANSIAFDETSSY